MGEFFALLASFAFALSTVLAQKGTRTGSGDNGTFISILQSFFLCSLIVLYLIYKSGPIHISLIGFIWFIIGGVLSSFIGRFYLYASIQRLGSVRASAVKCLTPIFSVAFGVMLFGETLTIKFCLGILFVFTGLYMMIKESFAEELKSPSKSANVSGIETDGTKIKKPSLKMQILLNIGFIFGALSALSYTLGLVVRKKGMFEVPDALLGATLGAMIGGFVGIVIYLVLAYFKTYYRTAVTTTFTQYNGYLLLGGFIITAGQVFNFVSINYIDVSRAGLLFTSQSIFAIIITKWFVKTNDRITRYTLLSIALMIAGTIVIILD